MLCNSSSAPQATRNVMQTHPHAVQQLLCIKDRLQLGEGHVLGVRHDVCDACGRQLHGAPVGRLRQGAAGRGIACRGVFIKPPLGETATGCCRQEHAEAYPLSHTVRQHCRHAPQKKGCNTSIKVADQIRINSAKNPTRVNAPKTRQQLPALKKKVSYMQARLRTQPRLVLGDVDLIHPSRAEQPLQI